MSSTFRGLETGRSGINAAMIALEVTGQNIANENTEGYTRQRVVSSAIKPPGSRYLISQVYNRMVGQGVKIEQIEQLRSEYLDDQFRKLNTTYDYYEYRMQGLSYLTGVMNELDETGSVTVALDGFTSAITILTQDASSEEYRLNLQQKAFTLTKTLNYKYEEMISLANSQNDSVYTTVNGINSIAEQFAHLNKSIAEYERNGQAANELRDDRNLLLDKLSGYVNIEYDFNAENDSMLDLKIGGVSLVTGKEFNTIQMTPAAEPNPLTGINRYELTLDGTELQTQYTAQSGEPVNITGGELYAHIEMLENSSSENAGIPYYVSKLNELCQHIAKTVNTSHHNGYTFPDEENGFQSVQNVDFFEVPAADDGTGNMVPDYSLITAGNFAVSDAVTQSVWNIAASDQLVDLNAIVTQSGNAGNMLALQSAFEKAKIYDELNTTVAHVAVSTETCQGLLDTSDSLRGSVDSQRKSISSVSRNEETTNLIMYQQSYEASARMITTIDQMLDKLINGTGTVGL